MSYGGLWGAIQTPFMTPAQVQVSTASTATPVPIIPYANQTTPYFSTFEVVSPIQGNILPIGAFENSAIVRFSTTSSTSLPQPPPLTSLLPMTVAASPVRPYFS